MTSACEIAAQTRSFDVEAGSAGTTLRDFARQAKVSIVVDRQKVQGVQTDKVSGLLVPSHALERMLEGTPLVFDEDLKTGAFAITRSDEPIGTQTTKRTDSKMIEKTDMNTKKTNWFKTLTAVLTLGIAGSQGQLNAQEENTEEIYELSPFTVDASNDTGYRSSSTLAGTRLRSDLKDLGSSISIINGELMDDIGATNAGDLLSYVAGVEVGGTNGNFSAANFGAGWARSNEMRRRPQDATRVRGLASAGLTRNLFLTDIPFDTYNTDRVEVQRGPNAILFGLGSPGGIINSGLISATFNGDHYEFRAQVDDVSGTRYTMDFNNELIDDVLALRISTLYEEKRYDQEQAYLLDKRIFATAVYRPRLFKGDSFSETVFKVNGEYGESHGTPADYIGPIDSISPWFTDAYNTPVKPLWDATLEGTFPEFRLDRDQGLRNPGLFGEPVFVFESPDSIEPTGFGGDGVGFQPFISPALTNEFIGPGGRFRGTLDIGGFPSSLSDLTPRSDL